MASKPATKPYTVYYKDGTYLTYDLSKPEYEAAEDALMKGLPAIKTRIGVLRMDEVRAVILQRKNADVPQHKGADPELPAEAKEWIKSQKLGERALDDELDDDGGEVDYQGGMIS